ncbi:TRAP transporter small permease [Arenibacterium sp. LLYu02]|uniref:TRAP transporter small permease n=1 Tax=Arenibacterium sp. LLYu02 TaxID=3404132 RepID=UPI003B212740
MRKLLDTIYLVTCWASAAIILGIALLVSTQVLLNVTTRVFDLPLPSTIPSYADFAGFMLAAATFLAMPYTFRSAGHIRVTLITARLPGKGALVAEVLALIVAAGLSGYACYYIFALVAESWHYNDTSSGMIPIPLWMPQSVMALGMSLLCLAILDTLIGTLRAGHPIIENAEEV